MDAASSEPATTLSGSKQEIKQIVYVTFNIEKL